MNKTKLILFTGLLLNLNLNCFNHITLASYEAKAKEYMSNTLPISDVVKEWLNKTLSYIKKEDNILEIGSGFGRDAKYLESLGYKVQRSDATKAFLDILKKQGHEARLLNILTHEIDKGYSLIFANLAFPHLPVQEFIIVLHKILLSLKPEGVLSFSLKYGDGEEWTEKKFGHDAIFFIGNLM